MNNRDFTDYFLKLYAGEAYRTRNLREAEVRTASPTDNAYIDDSRKPAGRECRILRG
jgi:hypothetical protein